MAIVVGIAGGTASGKSTICKKLEERISDKKVRLFHIDDYYKEKKPSITAPFTGKVYEDHNHPDAIDFDKFDLDLVAGMNSDYDVIIVEGLMTLSREEIRTKLDYKVFVDCKADERIVRRLRRNMEWGLSFDEIASVYLDAVRHRHEEFVEQSRWYADIVLNGSTPSEAGFNSIVLWINSAVK